MNKIVNCDSTEEVFKTLKYAEKMMNSIDLIDDFGISGDNKQMALAINEYLNRGGKYLRPAEVLSTIRAYDNDRRLGKWAATSLQFDHNWFLIHDDIEDGSFTRRGKPCLHILYGDDFAINYGDYLRTLSDMAIHKGLESWNLNTFKRISIARNEMLKTTCQGQDLEFILRKKPLSEATEKKVLDILENKSAFYTIFTPFRYGAVISHITDKEIEGFKKPLMDVGVAFQIQDDVLNLKAVKSEASGDATLESQNYGKDWLGDLEELKRTFPLVKLVKYATGEERKYILKTLDNEGLMRKLVAKRDKFISKRLESDIRFKKLQNEIDEIKTNILVLMRNYGVIEESENIAKTLRLSIKQVEERLPDTEFKKEYLDLLYYAIFRTF